LLVKLNYRLNEAIADGGERRFESGPFRDKRTAPAQ